MRLTDNFNLMLFSREAIKDYSSIGINRSPADLNEEAPLFFAFDKVFRINLPKFMTFLDLLDFISKQTNISINELSIYEYDVFLKEHLIKRNDFIMREITQENLRSSIVSYSKISKNFFPIFYIHTSEKYQLFGKKNVPLQDSGTLPIEDYDQEKEKEIDLNISLVNSAKIEEDLKYTNLDQTETGIIHITNSQNNLAFCKNETKEIPNHRNQKHVLESDLILNNRSSITNSNDTQFISKPKSFEEDNKARNLIFLKFLLPDSLVMTTDNNTHINKIHPGCIDNPLLNNKNIYNDINDEKEMNNINNRNMNSYKDSNESNNKGNKANEILNNCNKNKNEYSLKIIKIFEFIYNKNEHKQNILLSLKRQIIKNIFDYLKENIYNSYNNKDSDTNNIYRLSSEEITALGNSLENLDYARLDIVIERTCILDFPQENFYDILSEANLIQIFENNQALVLILSVSELGTDQPEKQPFITKNEFFYSKAFSPQAIKNKIADNFSKVYIDLFCLNINNTIFSRMEIDMREINDEKSIKEKLLALISANNLFSQIFNIKNHFILTSDKSIITSREFVRNIDSTYFEIANDRDTNGKIIQMYKDNPLSRYINYKEMRIDLSFGYLSKSQLSEKKNMDINIYDADSNKISVLSCALPKKLRRCREILEYILSAEKIYSAFKPKQPQSDLLEDKTKLNLISETKTCKNSNSSSNNENKINNNSIANSVIDTISFNNNKNHKYQDGIINIENCFFSLQHPKQGFIYHFISDKNTDLYRYDGKGDFEFRLQIYDDEFISRMSNPNFSKLYVKVVLINKDKTVNVDPLVIYLEKNQTNFELKLEINKHLAKISKIINALKDNSYSSFEDFYNYDTNFDKVKYFKGNVIEGRYKKNNNLSIYKEDDKLENMFKGDRIWNICIELNIS